MNQQSKFVNLLMIDGKKSRAFKCVCDALFYLKRYTVTNDSTSVASHASQANDGANILATAIKNVTPSVEVKKVRRAGNTFLIPAILSQHKAETLAMRWIIESARKKQRNSTQSFSECLADEIYQAFNKQGKARQKRDELHTIATQNRANIRFRWW
jgi:small subunit ribosomal protein S7